MAFADLLGIELTGHTFSYVLHFRITKPNLMTNAQAAEIIEVIINRSLTGSEKTQLLTMISQIEAGDYTVEDVEKVQGLVEGRYITNTEAKALLGI